MELGSERVFDMTDSLSKLEEQRALSRRQGGFGLIEALIGMVMVALLIGAGATGLQVLQNSSREGNQTARMDAVLVGASEAVRETAYVECAEPEVYQRAILDADAARTDDQNLIRETGSGAPEVRITGVTSETCSTPEGDNGRQSVKVSVTNASNGKVRIAKVTKVDSARRLRLPVAKIDAPMHQTKAGDIRSVFSLTATDSMSFHDLYKFEWDCDADGVATMVPGTEKTGETTSADQQMLCQYVAGPSDRLVRVTLQVTDSKDQTSQAEVDVTVDKRTDPRLPPVAAASVVGGTNVGIPGTTFGFSSLGTVSPYGTPLSFSWNFGDPASGSSNISNLENPTHTFFRLDDSYQVTLTVTDEFGLSSPAGILIKIQSTSPPPPTATFAQPNPAPGVFHVSTPVPFDGRPSRDHAGAPVSSYLWDFGDGQTSTSPAPTHVYKTSGTHEVKLTVKDSTGQTSFTTRDILVKTLDAPANFRVSGAQYMLPLIRWGYLDFAWTPLQSAPGENLQVEVQIQESQPVNACWIKNVTKPGIALSSGKYRWSESSVSIGQTFCAGSTYPYRARVVNIAAPRVDGLNPGPWSSPVQKRSL
ncbi:PKD domain-containing protein [Candidatus Microthrix parvicella]|uniref:PKD domain-containing protein n=1 Tax=Candidatus Neomicrothrix parvicella TaxID=41950 RepID=UPI00038081F1|nr:PKD domain-containing protein [Candidatus Microthrix parvicella]